MADFLLRSKIQPLFSQYKELAIFSKTVRWIRLAWLKSQLRKKLLLLRHGVFVLCRNKAPAVDVYLALNDPYSFILVQVLPELSSRYHIRFKIYMVNDQPSGIVENPGLWQQWTLKDAKVTANHYQLISPESYPPREHIVSGQQLWQLTAKSVDDALMIFKQVWQNEITEEFPSSTPVINHLIRNQERQIVKGHYLPATIYFLGEWYWGIDRLSYFEQSLLEHNLNIDSTSVFYDKEQLKLSADTQRETQDKAIEVYLSICNPYSYVGLKKVEKISQSYQVPLVLKPILPGAMRGRPTLQLKLWNDITDSLREAQKYQIPFNSYVTPSFDSILTVYALFTFAQSKNLAQAYLGHVFDAIYRDNLDISSAENLKLVCNKSGIDYQEAKQYSTEYDWQSWVDQHHQEMEQMGFFSSPSFRYGDIEVWGQDKLWLIEQAILDEV